MNPTRKLTEKHRSDDHLRGPTILNVFMLTHVWPNMRQHETIENFRCPGEPQTHSISEFRDTLIFLLMMYLGVTEH